MNQNLVTLLANNPGIEIKAPDGEYELLNTWIDRSLSFKFKKRQNLTSLLHIKFPEQLVAVYNTELKRLEFIFTAVEKDIKLKDRKFNFLFKGNNFQCSFGPIDLLDYIYAVLHSPTYREKYKEFLKIDFPRVPYPKDTKTFWELVDLGSQIREIHLLESPTVDQYITQFNIDGDFVVEKPQFVIANDSEAISNNKTASCLAVTGCVWINETQYFENVPEVA